MPPQDPKEAAQTSAPAEPMYPSIEAFIETAQAADIEGLYTPLKESLSGLKGPRAEQGKKASKAIERTEELLQHLLQVREKLEEERRVSAQNR